MNPKQIPGIDKEEWNDFVAGSPNGSILQSYEWGEFKACFGWKPLRIAIRQNGRIIAGISILKREIPMVRHALFYAPRGPMVDFSNKDLLHELLGLVEHEAEKHHAISLKIDPEISFVDAIALANLKNSGFVKALKEIQPRATIMLDIGSSPEEIIKGFEEKFRYNIRLAEKKRVEAKEDPSEEGIEKFYAIYQETARRDKFMVHPMGYYKKIREILFLNGLGTNFIAYYNKRPIAAIIIFAFGGRIWYMYGASSGEYRNVMPNHLLHWEAIKWAKERGLSEYDLWGVPANLYENHPLYGVYRFKKGFNGKMVKYIGALDFQYSPLLYHLFEHGIVWWKNFRSLLAKGKIEDSLSE